MNANHDSKLRGVVLLVNVLIAITGIVWLVRSKVEELDRFEGLGHSIRHVKFFGWFMLVSGLIGAVASRFSKATFGKVALILHGTILLLISVLALLIGLGAFAGANSATELQVDGIQYDDNGQFTSNVTMALNATYNACCNGEFPEDLYTYVCDEMDDDGRYDFDRRYLRDGDEDDGEEDECDLTDEEKEEIVDKVCSGLEDWLESEDYALRCDEFSAFHSNFLLATSSTLELVANVALSISIINFLVMLLSCCLGCKSTVPNAENVNRNITHDASARVEGYHPFMNTRDTKDNVVQGAAVF